MMVALLQLMLMPMLMMLDLTLMLLLDAFKAAAYAAAVDANADAKMPNASRHLAGAYDVLLLPPLLPMLMLLRPLLRDTNRCYNVMLKCF